mmetsp:Transcript_32681/g.56825  ORF Transcript_32681/g.56825 Transcript_32681/m.56825 type:complete len:322 (+) Transcript_32681:1316-2281(+)
MKELNPVQRYNRKLKEKKKLRRTIHKLNKRQDEPYEPRKRHKSPEPEPSNDPMLQELITAHSLRKRDEPDVVEEHIEEPVELPVQKPQTVLLPTSLIHKQMNQTLKEGDDSSSSVDEEPPPLEDMSEFLAKRHIVEEAPKAVIVQPQAVPAAKPKASGLKKGFFNAAPKPKAKVKKQPEIPLIKAKQQRNPLELPDVQAAMQYTETNQSEWLSPALMEKIASNPTLTAGFSNPVCMQAIQEFQKDPARAKARYASDAVVTTFLVEFAKLMAGHFGTLAEEKKTDLDRKIEADPELQVLMQDKDVQHLLRTLQSGVQVELHE